MDTFTTVLSVFSTVCAIVFGYIAFVRNRDKDKESNVKHDATVLTEIGYIKANTDEIKAEQKEQRKTNTEFITRLTNVEASAKQAHKRLDHIEKRMDQAEYNGGFHRRAVRFIPYHAAGTNRSDRMVFPRRRD